jgi:diaminohydroxyphosphoribosylaminopyrimidine deaminase / 5-amino-6-(5-phosphoribosylamino)uracil reductase
MSLERAFELAERGRGTTHPNPVVGAVIARDGKVVGEGWHERKGEAHAEARALEQAGDRANGATLYVSMEPCRSWGDTPPCTKAVLESGITQVVAGSLDPNPEAGGGLEELRTRGVDVSLAEGVLGFRARQQNEEWRTWVTHGRPYVTYKAAVTLDGRMTVPGERWVTGEESRRIVHMLRAASDAVAVGMGTVRADDPRLDARDVDAAKQPRRLAFGQGPLPAGSELELLSGSLDEELARLASEGVQSLLLEGGPKLAESFLRADLVDKLLLFVAPKLAGEGSGLIEALPIPVALTGLSAHQVGDDVLLSAYVHEP